jgi:starch synthase (maltosyl-transferring)
MRPLGNDYWESDFVVDALGTYLWKIEAWPDAFGTWQRDLRKWLEAGEDVSVELQAGAALVHEAAARARGADATALQARAEVLGGNGALPVRTEAALDAGLAELVGRYPDPGSITVYDPGLRISVDRERARFGAWYELFPRSTAPEPGRHGTFDDVIARLPYVAGLGFDVLYLPPVHPIGETNRKGRNNTTRALDGDVGSPWAIGSRLGGHKAVHPGLGTLAGFRRLVAAARDHGLEVALDIALQVAPDHPYVAEHPDWFRHRPDGSIRYAENPPKRYEDIYPFDFDTLDHEALWHELESVVRFWVEQGVRIFRVDNPHTKPFAFWEWLIGSSKRDFPEVLFLSEAFTRPHVMHYLAKLGFSQSYTYFTWRNGKQELIDYFRELTDPRSMDYFRPNVWPNTPDILHEYLQHGGRPAFVARIVLATMLAANYGIYGPAFELGVNQPREPGSEEYRDSEKYEVKRWNLDAPHSLSGLIATLNRIRRENAALQRDDGLRFHDIDNDQLIAFSKRSPDAANVIITVVNLDPDDPQSGTLDVSLEDFGWERWRQYYLRDLVEDRSLAWDGNGLRIELHPAGTQARILRLE